MPVSFFLFLNKTAILKCQIGLFGKDTTATR